MNALDAGVLDGDSLHHHRRVGRRALLMRSQRRELVNHVGIKFSVGRLLG